MKVWKTLSLIVALLAFAPLALAEEARSEKEAALRKASQEVRMAVQAICPVSGQKLGEHGDPILVKIGEEQVFLCCKGCASGKINAKHWATIHTNFAKAQRICPVMKHELPKSAKWTVVEGRIVYVCCPPCIEKIKAEPVEYLKAVDSLYAASRKALDPAAGKPGH